MKLNGKANSGEQQTGEMFRAIGQAITRWSFVESELCTIFTTCTSNVVHRAKGGLILGNPAVPVAVFFKVENFRGKLGLVDAALRALCAQADGCDQLLSEWSKLHDKTTRLSRRRNQLAHFMVMPGFDYQDDTIPPRLVPAHGSPAYWRETGSRSGKQTFRLSHVQQVDRAFWCLQDRLNDFGRKLAANEGLFDLALRKLALFVEEYEDANPDRGKKLRSALVDVPANQPLE